MMKAFRKPIEIDCARKNRRIWRMEFSLSRVLRKLFEREIAYAGRDASASPAVGSLVRHKREQACVVADAFKV